MMTARITRFVRASIVASLALAPGGTVAVAGEPQVRADAQPAGLRAAPDFLLGAPRAWIGLRGSMVVPRAGGDLFAFVTDQLTLGRADLRSRGFASDLGIVITPKFDAVLGVDVSRRDAASEYRRLVTSDRQAIQQTTRLNQASLSAGVRVSPFGRGRRVSRYAYIPSRLAPYAGAGVTAVHYSFSQRGQFVDFADNSIFSDRFVSDGWAAGPYINGGLDLQVWKRLYVSVDGRFAWLHGALDPDFSGFDGIDLAGFRGGTGLSIMF